MSDMAKSFARAKLAALPPEAPLTEEPEDDQYSSASSVSSTGTVRPTSANKKKEDVAALTASGWHFLSSRELSGLSVPTWSDFFQQELYLNHTTETQSAQYHVYVAEPTHTPGSSKAQHPIIVLQHGAGSSAMTFALFVGQLRQLLPDAGIIAVDARNHGESTVRDAKTGELDLDMSIDTLANDLVLMVRLTTAKLNWSKVREDGEIDLPSMLLVGHSLGGAIVTHTASTAALGNLAKSGKRMNSNVIGFCVIDAVEGYAVEALKHMRAYLAKRPSSFDSVEDGIDWHIRSKTLRNIDSARLSVPPILIPASQDGKWLWRTDLSVTEDYWGNWFTGMSNKFLSATGAKLLILAGTDRLDKDLTIGQMQGKFQLQVIPEAGHFVQEDCPEKTANLIAEFLKRNDRSALVLPPKVSDMIAQGMRV